MKQILVALALSLGLSAAADSFETNSFSVRYVGDCISWVMLNSNSGFGYGCSGYPLTVQVPDAPSLKLTIDRLEQRIQVLESRLIELETSANTQE